MDSFGQRASHMPRLPEEIASHGEEEVRDWAWERVLTRKSGFTTGLEGLGSEGQLSAPVYPLDLLCRNDTLQNPRVGKIMINPSSY